MERVLIRSGDDILIMKTDDIDWIEAAGNYVYLHTGKKSRLLRETMNNLQENSIRINLSASIAHHREYRRRIRKMQPSSHVIDHRDGDNTGDPHTNIPGTTSSGDSKSRQQLLKHQL